MGIIFDIQRFSIHDGPGIRTTVFFKGCNNKCLWCHNPESLKINPQIQTYFNKCIGCGQCFEVCPYGCHVIYVDSVSGTSERVFKRKDCTGCGICTESCYANALVLCGEEKTAQEILVEVMTDKSYYDQSGGGVTISGGEPFLQVEFLLELLKLLKKNNIHTAVQTALNIDFDHVLKAAPYVDLFMCDFKVYDPLLHKKYIGNDGIRIKENLKRLPELKQFDTQYAVRTPVIGGLNDNKEEIGSIMDFLNKYVHPLYYELMPYHNLGISKMETLGMNESELGEAVMFTAPSENKMKELNDIINIEKR